MSRKSKNELIKKSLAGESALPMPTPLRKAGTVNADPAEVYFMTYIEQLKDPRWQKMRLEILNRDEFTCQVCGSKEKELHVHHLIYYQGRKIWDYSDIDLITLCTDCHKSFHEYKELVDEFIVSLLVNYDPPAKIEDIALILNLWAIDYDFYKDCLKKAEGWTWEEFLNR